MAEKKVYPPFTEMEYCKTWAGFLECTDQYAGMSRLIKQISHLLQGRKVHLLSIGAGSGTVEKLMLEDHGLQLSFYYAIEPSESRRDELKEFVESWEEKVPCILDPCYFTPEFKTDHSFDIILMSHSLYHMAKWQEALVTAHSHLNPGGKIVLFHLGDEENIQIELLKDAVIHPKPWCSHLVVPSQIEAFLTGLNIEHGLHLEPGELLVDKFLSKDPTGGNTFAVDFLLQTWYNNLTENHQQKIYNFVVKNTEKCSNGKNWLKLTVAMFVICK